MCAEGLVQGFSQQPCLYLSKTRIQTSPSRVKLINYWVYDNAVECYAAIKLVVLHEFYLHKVKKS